MFEHGRVQDVLEALLGVIGRCLQRLWGCKNADDDRAWHLRKKWGHLRLRDVNNREAVLTWHSEMLAEGASDAKVFQAHGLLVNIITQAVELEYLPRTRLSSIQPYYEPGDTGDPWLPEDIEAIRSHLFWRAEDPPRGHGAPNASFIVGVVSVMRSPGCHGLRGSPHRRVLRADLADAAR